MRWEGMEGKALEERLLFRYRLFVNDGCVELGLMRLAIPVNFHSNNR
jgi:hypothetical protein